MDPILIFPVCCTGDSLPGCHRRDTGQYRGLRDLPPEGSAHPFHVTRDPVGWDVQCLRDHFLFANRASESLF